MNSFDEVMERIRDVISGEKDGRVMDRDVAKALDLTSGNLATLKSRDRLPIEAIAAFCAKRSISINWILFNQSAESVVKNTERFAYVRYFRDVSLSAGGGAFDADEEAEELALPPIWVEKLGGEREIERIEAVNVTGDSMEPTLKSGDILFVHRQKQNIKNGGVFAVATPFGLFVKRLEMQVDGSLMLISDNDDYPPQRVATDDVEVIGQAVAVFSSEL